MSTRKRTRDATSTSSSMPSEKRALSVSTVQKWIRENDKSMQTMTWPKFNRCENDVNHMTSLCCSVCQEFDDRLRGMRNYSAAFIIGATNLRCSNFKDHSKTDMHTKAMSLYREKTARSSVMESAPIVRALNTMDKFLEEKMILKFQVAFTIAREGKLEIERPWLITT